MPTLPAEPRRLLLAPLLLACLVCAGPARAVEPAATVPPVALEADRFYAPPPGFAAAAPGSVLRSRGVPLSPVSALSLSGAAAAHQLLVRSSTVDGSPTVTTATILLPRVPAPGPRRLVSQQLAEDSLTTRCAPSYTTRMTTGASPLNEDEFKFASAALARGWDVVFSDYEGPDSQLLVGPVEGRMTLDGIRAAISFSPSGLPGASTQVGLVGYSGGSVPSLWAGALAPSYAPEVHLAAITAGGVAADLRYILARLDGTLLFGGALVSLVGIDRAYPELDLHGLLNDRGRREAAAIGADAKGCAGAVAGYPFEHASDYFDVPSTDALASIPRVRAVLDRLSLAEAPTPAAPVLLHNATNDEIMFPPQVQRLADTYCAAGVVTQLDVVPGDHVSAGESYGVSALTYLVQRFGGATPASNCTRSPPRPSAPSPTASATPRRCSSRRILRYRLPSGARLRAVSVAGRHIATSVRGTRVTVSLAGRRGNLRVVLRATTASGRPYVRRSVVHLCARSPSLTPRAGRRGRAAAAGAPGRAIPPPRGA